MMVRLWPTEGIEVVQAGGGGKGGKIQVAGGRQLLEPLLKS